MRENAWVAAFLFPAALLWYGWTADKGVFWLVPLIANFFFGVGCMLYLRDGDDDVDGVYAQESEYRRRFSEDLSSKSLVVYDLTGV